MVKIKKIIKQFLIQGRENIWEWLKQRIYFLLTDKTTSCRGSSNIQISDPVIFTKLGNGFHNYLKETYQSSAFNFTMTNNHTIMCPRNSIIKFLSYFIKFKAMVGQTDIVSSLTALPFSRQTFAEEQQTLKMEDQLQDDNWQMGWTH